MIGTRHEVRKPLPIEPERAVDTLTQEERAQQKRAN